jgi:outer membrane lipoprotein carrier protein
MAARGNFRISYAATTALGSRIFQAKAAFFKKRWKSALLARSARKSACEVLDVHPPDSISLGRRPSNRHKPDRRVGHRPPARHRRPPTAKGQPNMNTFVWLLAQALSFSPDIQGVDLPAAALAESSLVAIESSKSTKPSAPLKASQILAKVQAFYASASDVQASFRQVHYKPETAAAAPVTGMLKVKKRGKMILDYDGDTPDLYLNGRDMWQIDFAMRQVSTMTLDEDPSMTAGLSFLFGGEEILRDYLVRRAANDRQKKYGDADHVVLQLKPRKHNEHFKGLIFGVHVQSGRVDRVIVYGHDGSTNQFDLNGSKVNSGLSDEIFQKKIPAGFVQVDGQI